MIYFLSRNLTFAITAYPKEYTVAETQKTAIAQPFLMKSFVHSAIQLTSTAIVLGIGCLNPSYKLELTDASGKIVTTILCITASTAIDWYRG